MWPVVDMGAVKIDDGAMRARTPVTVALLRALGVDPAALDELSVDEVRGGDGRVGAIRPVPGVFGAPEHV